MRIAGPSLALSLLLLAGPAFAQGGGGQMGQGQMGQDRYDLSPQGEQQQEQMQRGPMQQGQRQQGMMQGQMPHDMQQHRGMMQQHRGMMGQMHPGMQDMRPGTSGRQMGQTDQSRPGIVSFATRGKIKESLEQSGFRNVVVLPQSYLIRAQAPDGSRVVMQVSPEGMYGVVVEPQESSGGGTGTGRENQNR